MISAVNNGRQHDLLPFDSSIGELTPFSYEFLEISDSPIP